MSNVCLSAEKREQVVALGRLGWSLRRIEQTTGVRRETASGYLKAAGVAVRPPGGWGRLRAKPANGVTTDSGAGNRVLDGLTIPPVPRSLSSAEPYREIIEPALMRGRNAMAIWQDLVSDHGFGGSYEAVKRLPSLAGFEVTTEALCNQVWEPPRDRCTALTDFQRGPALARESL